MVPQNPFEPPKTEPSTALPDSADLSHEEVFAFVGRNGTYYWDRWRGVAPGKMNAGFNVGAFFLSVIWLAYRRLYRELGVAVAILVGLGLLQGVLDFAAPDAARAVDRVTNIAFAVTFGMMGNGLYLRRARAEIAIARRDESDPDRRLQRIAAAGGPNLFGAIGCAVVLLGLGVAAVAVS